MTRTALDQPKSEALSCANKPEGFYRPELDAIRFLAFLAIFFFHAPHIPRLEWLVGAGFYGLPLFFVLSAFLITEILLREQYQTGDIHLKAFYIRRTLRIWPLYFVGVLTAVLWGYYLQQYRLDAGQFTYLLLIFPAFAGRAFNQNPAGVLWSVSVEEIFYLIWPVAGKLKAFIWACIVLFVCAIVTILVTNDIWYNPLSQFYYFALGGLLALILRRTPIYLSIRQRAAGLLLSVGTFLVGSQLSNELARFSLGGLGCGLALVALLNMDGKWIPRAFVYLGKITYGLYVFHLSCLVLTERTLDATGVSLGRDRRALLVQCVALVASVAIASLSYRFLETPFLKLKHRFEFVKSRPI